MTASFAMSPTAIASVLALAMLSGCVERQDKAATQVAAKVNKEEISVHQVNFRLQQRPADLSAKQVLERLIDEELAVQKAEELRIDRDPKVVQAIDAARRDILAHAYQERIGDAAGRPSTEEARKYYDQNPALFKERRVYTLQEIAVEGDGPQIEQVKAQLQRSQSSAEFTDWLKANGIRFAANQAIRAAEQLPLATLPALARLKDGQAMLVPAPTGAQVVVVVTSRPAPVDEAKARPAIEQFLWNENKRRMVQSDLAALREAGRIEYVGKYADAVTKAASAPAGAR
jgi:EpsD family peptidyl-prolyl cis-trans isomerase